jgi:hypothetical protein
MIKDNSNLGTFPFGRKVFKISQIDRTPKPVFVLGVYGSAVFAQFNTVNSELPIRYLPIDNEPGIFWNGDQKTVKKIISDLNIPKTVGKLTPEISSVNGIIGKAFDKYYLHPLKLNRDQIWICNLIPYYVLNKNERKSVRKYNDVNHMFNLPKAEIPSKEERKNDLTKKRFSEIIEEIFLSKAEFIITLGQQPLKWFMQEYNSGMENFLNVKNYGSIIKIQLESVKFNFIPLFHPRQLLKEKNIDSRVGLLHFDWIKTKAKKIKLF